MKKLFLLPLSLALFTYCNQSTGIEPSEKENPWADNYNEISGMQHYQNWGTYNVHDPACLKIGDYYYMYSTDAIFAQDDEQAKAFNVPMGYIQVRRSKDLVNWEFVNWAFPEIPAEAVQWVRENSKGEGATNIWAPYLIQHENKFRLYYSVSAFGQKNSYIGLAESDSPEGPWQQIGCVVKTNQESVMNAIDPSVIVDEAGNWWMHYGSYFGGLFVVQLNPETGLTKTVSDQGELTARRADYKKDNLEAPEIIYNPELKQYYLFTSYEPLITTYNVRVGRSEHPNGPFFDYFGIDIRDTTNNFPIIAAPYRFDNHPGWSGTAHCGVFNNGEGKFFMAHQGRLAPHNHMMVLHLREVFFTEDGWPVVSPERYANTPKKNITQNDVVGQWEIIRIQEPNLDRKLEAGQVLWGEGVLMKNECNESFIVDLSRSASESNTQWSFDAKKQLLNLTIDGEQIDHLIVFMGQDWENEKETILFTGLDKKGRSVWGKRVL